MTTHIKIEDIVLKVTYEKDGNKIIYSKLEELATGLDLTNFIEHVNLDTEVYNKLMEKLDDK